MGLTARLAELIVPVKRLPDEPGGVTGTGATGVDRKTPLGLSVATTPLVIPSITGSPRTIWMMSLWSVTVPTVFASSD